MSPNSWLCSRSHGLLSHQPTSHVYCLVQLTAAARPLTSLCFLTSHKHVDIRLSLQADRQPSKSHLRVPCKWTNILPSTQEQLRRGAARTQGGGVWKCRVLRCELRRLPLSVEAGVVEVLCVPQMSSPAHGSTRARCPCAQQGPGQRPHTRRRGCAHGSCRDPGKAGRACLPRVWEHRPHRLGGLSWQLHPAALCPPRHMLTGNSFTSRSFHVRKRSTSQPTSNGFRLHHRKNITSDQISSFTQENRDVTYASSGYTFIKDTNANDPTIPAIRLSMRHRPHQSF